jgi:predicted metal-dependent RNase
MQSGKLPPQIRIIVDEAVKIGNSVYEAFPEYLDRELKERIMHSESTQFGFSENFVYSSEIVEIDKPSLIISAPSCLGGGNSTEYLRKIASDTQSMLLFLTYQPQGTVGRAILEGLKAPPIGTSGENIELSCKVQKLNGLDNHSDYNQLLAFVSRLRPKLRRVLVNHGERSKAQNLASSISKILKVQTQHPLVQEAVKLL